MENQENVVVETKSKKGIAKVLVAVVAGAAAAIGIKYFLKKRQEKQLLGEIEDSEETEEVEAE